MAKGRAKPMTEWEMYVTAARYWWPGTSLTDGAFAIMADIRRTHLEQFKAAKKKKRQEGA